jgi:WD40 repeat protein
VVDEGFTMRALLVSVIVIGSVAVTPASRDAVTLRPGSGPMLTNGASFDGRRLLLAGGDLPVASLWDLETGLKIQEFSGHSEGVRSVALSTDGRQALTGSGTLAIVSPSRDNSVRLWDISSGRELRRFNRMTYPAWAAPISEVAFTESGREVLGAGAGTRGALAIWDTATGDLLFEQPASRADGADSLCGRFVMTRMLAESVRTWEYRSKTMLASINSSDLQASWTSAGAPRVQGPNGGSAELGGRIRSSRCNPDGSMVAIASGRMASTWNSSTGRLVRIYVGPAASVSDVMFGADGKRLVAASLDGSVRLWDVSSGQLLGQLVHEGSVSRALISPDGRRLLTEWQFSPAGTGLVTDYRSLWDVNSGRELMRFDQRQRPLGFSPDGRTIPVVDGLAFGSKCCPLHSLLEASTGQPIRRFQP